VATRDQRSLNDFLPPLYLDSIYMVLPHVC